MRRGSVFLCVLLAGAASPLLAQDQNQFEDLFSSYSGRSGPGYLKPFAQILSGGLNTGFIRPARISPGFHLRIQIEAMSALISDAQKTFQATTDTGFFPKQTVAAPTIVGATTPVIVNGNGGLGYVFPAGLGVNQIAFGVPQITIGTIAGTEATFRYLGYSADKVGSFSLLGIGVRHSISRYLPHSPLDLAIGVAYHSLKMTDAAKLTSVIVSGEGSLQRGLLAIYGGVSYEKSDMKMDYANAGSPGGRAQYTVDGVNGGRITAGVELNLKIFRLHGDINLGSQRVIGLGIGFGG